MPFLMLALDLPPAPLYKDALEKDIIPQVPEPPLLVNMKLLSPETYKSCIALPDLRA